PRARPGARAAPPRPSTRSSSATAGLPAFRAAVGPAAGGFAGASRRVASPNALPLRSNFQVSFVRQEQDLGAIAPIVALPSLITCENFSVFSGVARKNPETLLQPQAAHALTASFRTPLLAQLVHHRHLVRLRLERSHRLAVGVHDHVRRLVGRV